MTAFIVPPSFKAFEFDSHSDSNPLQEIHLKNAVTLKPLEPTQVRVKVLSAGVNHLDALLVRVGPIFLKRLATKENPYRVGFDFAGVIVEVGSGDVDGFKVGDAVFGMPGYDNFGSWAEFMNVDVKFIALKPSNLTFDEAASLPLVSLTSYQSLITHGRLSAGHRVLILAGSGGVGAVGIQIAKAAGAYVITTTSPRNADFVKSLGADEVTDYTTAKWGDVIAPGSIDIIYNSGMEPESWNDAAQKVLKPNKGIFVALGMVKDPQPSPIGASFHAFHVLPGAEDLNELCKLIEDGKLKPTIDSVFPFDKALDALAHQLTRRARGKIVLHIADE